MVNIKQNRPEMVKRTSTIFKWQDQGLSDLVALKGESKDHHHRQALTEYIGNKLGRDYPENREAHFKNKRK
jgi:CRISPR/Cas system-associated protein Cas7 (RAMP superfamily)